VQPRDIDGIAVTVGPGLVGSLLVGVCLEQTAGRRQSHRGPCLLRGLWKPAG
jgi:tRNA A37 threonylcarbamoyltransferase TsaD